MEMHYLHFQIMCNFPVIVHEKILRGNNTVVSHEFIFKCEEIVLNSIRKKIVRKR